jgi:hypothetical protein
LIRVNHETQSLQKELTEKIDKTQVKLQAVEVSLDAQARKLQESHSATEATKREFQARLEVVEARAEQGRRPGVCANVAQLPILDGNTSWAVLRRQFETAVEHHHWWYQEKSTCLITALKGRAADILYGVPTNAT